MATRWARWETPAGTDDAMKPSRITCIRFDPVTRRRVDELARQRGTTASEVVRRLVWRGLKAADEGAKP